MAGNSVPVFFGAQARSIRPVAVDITFACDRSGSMSAYTAFISSLSTIQSLEQALLSENIGITQNNRYSITSGASGPSSSYLTLSYLTLSGIEYYSVISGVNQRWAPGPNIVAGNVTWPTLLADAGDSTEDMVSAAHLIATGSRNYAAGSQRIIVSAGDLQSPYLETLVSTSNLLATLTAVATKQRYVGVHNANISISEPASPNPVPPGSLFGFVYSGNLVGTAIYLNGSTLHYREDVTISNVTVTFAGTVGGYGPKTIQQANQILDLCRQTNGALYRLALTNTTNGTAALGVSLGQVLGKYLYETES